MLMHLHNHIKLKSYIIKYLRLLWIVPITCGLISCTGSGQRDTTLPAFTDVTVEAGLGEFRYENCRTPERWMPETFAAGCGFIDYDSDGWMDILLVGGGPIYTQEALIRELQQSGRGLTRETFELLANVEEERIPALYLYRNNGDGTFSLKSDEAGLGDLHTFGGGVGVADYDNDGDDDIYFTTLRENILLRNDGGRFTDVTEVSGTAGRPVWSTSVLFFDSDKDGWLDLYVCNYVDWSLGNDVLCTSDGISKDYCNPELYTGVPGRFYRNNGDGTFTDQTAAAGFINSMGKSLGVVELDFNKDGWPDVAVSCDLERNLLYENNRDGTFTEKGVASGIAFNQDGVARSGMGIDVGVVDNTGEETIFIGNFSLEMIGVFRHMTDGLFSDRAIDSRIGQISWLTLTFGLFLFDVDLDGDLDLFGGNGHIHVDIATTGEGISYEQPPHLFMNRGDGTFEDAARDIGGALSQFIVCRGAAYADYDRDGDQDILIITNNGPAYLWRNDRQTGHFLRVQLEGKQINRNAIGTRIVVVVGNQRMERRIRTGISYMSAMEKTVTFGLGESTIADSLLIYWPNNQVTRFADVGADQEVLVVEGTETLERQPLPGFAATTSPEPAIASAQ